MPRSYRIYFNRRDPKGCAWSIDEGQIASEIHVQAVSLGSGVGGYTVVNHDAADGEPSGWLQVHGVELTIDHGCARLELPKIAEG